MCVLFLFLFSFLFYGFFFLGVFTKGSGAALEVLGRLWQCSGCGRGSGFKAGSGRVVEGLAVL